MPGECVDSERVEEHLMSVFQKWLAAQLFDYGGHVILPSCQGLVRSGHTPTQPAALAIDVRVPITPDVSRRHVVRDDKDQVGAGTGQ